MRWSYHPESDGDLVVCPEGVGSVLYTRAMNSPLFPPDQEVSCLIKMTNPLLPMTSGDVATCLNIWGVSVPVLIPSQCLLRLHGTLGEQSPSPNLAPAELGLPTWETYVGFQTKSVQRSPSL